MTVRLQASACRRLGSIEPCRERFAERTRWGLTRGTACVIVGRRAGGVRIKRASDGRTFIVGPTEVKRAA